MSFPMRRVFSNDRRRGFNDIVVYEFLELELHHRVPTEWKLSVIALGTGVAESHVSIALKHLVAWGYLRDFRKSKADPRLLTIAKEMPTDLAA